MNKKLLIYDTNNLFHKNYHKNKNYGTVDEALDMTLAESIREMKMYYDKFKPFMTFAAFDSKENWRKEYTKNKSKRVTDKVYKANRSQKKTRKELETKKRLDERIQEFAEFIKNDTKIIALWEQMIEADDFVGSLCEIFSDGEFDIKIVSSDKDYLQLLRYDNVEIINPLQNGKKRDLSEWNNDAELFMLEKCIRGDSKDNVRSSYPRLQKKKMIEAYYDDFKKSNILNHTFTEIIYDEDSKEYIEKEYSTEKLFEENKMLLDLTAQPKHIKKEINELIERETIKNRQFNFPKFLKFCQKYELNNIKSRAQSFIPFFSNQRKN